MRCRPQARHLPRLRAESEQKDKPGPEDVPTVPPSMGPVSNETPTNSSEDDEASKKGGLAPGQGTAIWTGAVSLLLGIAYIALTVALDSRGELLPPPPEAFQ